MNSGKLTLNLIVFDIETTVFDNRCTVILLSIKYVILIIIIVIEFIIINDIVNTCKYYFHQFYRYTLQFKNLGLLR